MTDPDLKVVVDDLRATSGTLDDLASGFYNDGGGPILKSVTGADSELDASKACGELGDSYLAYAQTLGVGVTDLAGKLDSAAYLYENGDSAAAESIEFDPPEKEELEIGDDPGEPGYDPVDEYEDALQQAGLLDGESSGLYREWLQNAADNGVPPETIVDIARQENLTPQSFDVLNAPGMKRVTDDNDTPNDPSDDKDYWVLPENATADQARQATLMTYIYNAGTGYGTAEGSENNDFAETPYSAAEVSRIRERQADNWWSYELLPTAMDDGGRFATTPNGMLMGLGGGLPQQVASMSAGTCFGDVFAVNYDHPTNAAADLERIITSGDSTFQIDGEVRTGNDLDRVLHHEERHSQQWAQRGPTGMAEYAANYFTAEGYARITDTHNSFEEKAGAADGGYH